MYLLLISRLLYVDPGQFTTDHDVTPQASQTIALPSFPYKDATWYWVAMLFSSPRTTSSPAYASTMSCSWVTSNRPYLFTKITDCQTLYIKIMTDTIKKYKTSPKLQEVISSSMFYYIASLYCHAPQDSFIRAVTNWIILGCYRAFKSTNRTMTNIPYSRQSFTPNGTTAQYLCLSLPMTLVSQWNPDSNLMTSTPPLTTT